MLQLPKINIKYWMLMIIATTIGEIVGNLISRNFELGYTKGSIILSIIYILSIAIVVKLKKNGLLQYWFLIVAGNIAGTNYADFITIEPLKLGTIYGSLLILALLIFILLIWKFIAPKSNLEGKLSDSIFYLYWLAILMSSTFGTTAGDFLSNDTPLGAGGGSLLLLGIWAVVFLLDKLNKISFEISYWIILILIHPIGATIGNYISKPAGLDLGNIWTSIFLISLFLFLFFKKAYHKHT